MSSVRVENMDIKIGAIQFIFIDDSGGRHIPVLALKAQVDVWRMLMFSMLNSTQV